MNWLRRLIERIRLFVAPTYPRLPSRYRKAIKRADDLLERADRVIGEIRRVDGVPH